MTLHPLAQGSQFNIKAKSKNVTISGMGVHCILPQDKLGKVHIYTLDDDYYGGGRWYRKWMWKKVVETDVTCAGAGKVTEVGFPEVSYLLFIPHYSPKDPSYCVLCFQTVHVGQGRRQAFSVYVLTDNIRADYPSTRKMCSM